MGPWNIAPPSGVCRILLLEMHIGSRSSALRHVRPCSFSTCCFAGYIRETGLTKKDEGIEISGRIINNLKYGDDTTLIVTREDGMKDVLPSVKMESSSMEDNDTDHYQCSLPVLGPLGNFTAACAFLSGALLFDRSQGFWLVHSVPHFPPFPEDGFGYPHTGRRYGQVALCVTYKYEQFKQIAAQLLYYNPNVYNCSVPDAYHRDLWGLYRVCQDLPFPWIETTRLAVLESAQGEFFLNFAKSKYFHDDIVTAWMAQKLQTDLLAETWQPTGIEVPSNCTLPRHVYTIKRIKVANHSFYSRQDHSKWCVSRPRADTWTCLGDLNRYAEQIWRSGGFVCTQNKLLYSAFSSIVAYYSDCRK
ncbi:unnamed protein product [Ranitomeya imitator]|uniref:deoxyribonuclease II n=1 Tax=Ranitomeya imitator TaxID=111125 RepID=A0ABN9M4V7_9NEOB|nr:unnamed protein product [Ranitomeya imitator]